MSRFARRLQSSGKLPRLYLTPSVGSYTPNATFTVAIRTSTPQAINAVQANLVYPASRLEFVSLSMAGGAFSTTVENTGGGGEVRAAVASMGSSVTGDALVATVTFRALSAGPAVVTFAASSAMASAVTTTDICRLRQSGLFTVA